MSRRDSDKDGENEGMDDEEFFDLKRQVAEEERRRGGGGGRSGRGGGRSIPRPSGGTVIAVVWIAFIIGAAGFGWTYYASHSYKVDQAANWVDLAASSNDMTTVLADLNQSLAEISGFHGNPNPLFPQPNTNFDNIRQQIQSTITDGLAVANESPTAYSYQQALKNIQSDLTTTVEGDLQNTSSALMWWGFWVWFIVVLVVVVFVTIICWPT